MAVVLLILALVGIAVAVDAVLENTTSMPLSLFGWEISGLSQGEWLAVAAGLGFLIALCLGGVMGVARRRRSRRKDLHASRDEMADRVSELERENYSLREQARSQPPPHATPSRAEPTAATPTGSRRETTEGEPTRQEDTGEGKHERGLSGLPGLRGRRGQHSGNGRDEELRSR